MPDLSHSSQLDTVSKSVSTCSKQATCHFYSPDKTVSRTSAAAEAVIWQQERTKHKRFIDIHMYIKMSRKKSF